MRTGLSLSLTLVVLGLMFALCRADDRLTNKPEEKGTTHSVKMTAGNKFDPPEIQVKVGDQVKWVNEGGTHTATADDQTDLKKSFNTGTVKKGQEAIINCNNDGTFPYHCEFHNGMKGKIIVEK